MRCTKCSFISFDDLSACAKCASDLSLLSKELNGTCTEARLEFFLGSAIQAPILDEENFSDSQVLPPINQGEMNFDDTSSGSFSPLSAPPSGADDFDFNDSVGLSTEDDVAIELGDVMPIDFDQLDSGSGLSEGTLEQTDSQNFDDFNFDLDKSDNASTSTDQAIDLDFTTDLSDSTEDFQFKGDFSDIDIGDLSKDNSTGSTDVTGKFPEDVGFDQELFEHLADNSGSFDETTSLNPDAGLNATQLSVLSAGAEPSTPLELDESLVAELAGPSSLDVSGEFPINYSDHSASGDFELDDALVAELATANDTGTKHKELDLEHGLTEKEVLSFAQVENLTGDFPSVEEDDALSGLDLADIDVSDLLDNSDKTADSDNEGLDLPETNTPQKFNPSALNDTFRDAEPVENLLDEELVLDHADLDDDLPEDIDALALDDDFAAFVNKTASGDEIPEIKLISDDDEDGPPDLPH